MAKAKEAPQADRCKTCTNAPLPIDGETCRTCYPWGPALHFTKATEAKKKEGKA